ncbi:mannitol dehydrogenase family protein [Flexivirga alba]|uniref:Mannitol-1-phosphate 5-dehydrogenase n=1 Tax=Flexivirga alba TaxID=702742 RepID=A0ABW2AMW1_9MICO
MQRLALSTLPTASTDVVTLPAVDPRNLSTGLVHLGIGAFHRAHQAVYTELASAATGDDRWGIFAVTGRSANVVEQLAPQDGLYGVLTKSVERSTLHVVGAVREVISGGADQRSALAAIASPDVRVVTLTITEKGYPRTPDGGLALGTAAVTADVAAVRAALAGTGVPGPTGSSVGLLATGLAARFSAAADPISVVSCDNLPGNGTQLGRLVRELADAAGDDDFAGWLRQDVTFPSTMVDRIVPATTDQDRAEAAELLRLYDAGLVVAEPFGQWVIEDRFAADRPAWEQAGATLATEVAPYEKAKLRMLNGTHSLLAYLGALHGHRTIADAIADERLYDAARGLQREDAIPTLEAPPGVDLEAYGEQVLARFGNPYLRHTTVQVAMDGSQKLPIRLLDTAKDRLRAGATPHHCALAVAAWIVYVSRGRDTHGHELPLNDPLASVLRDRAAGSEEGLVDRMLGVREIFDDEIAGQDAFRDAVRDAAASLQRMR